MPFDVLFSSKVTNSVLVYLERKGFGLEALYSAIEVPEEFLRDPSSWIEAGDVEHFLSTAETFYAPKLKDEIGHVSLVQHVGKSCADLNAWGVLDGVLKMMQGPQDLYAQPGRFISYFVSPEPIVTELHKAKDAEKFQLELSSNDYPCFTTYLAAAIESLPTYVNQSPAYVTWNDTEIQIAWAKKQEDLFPDEEAGKNINPELLRNLVQSLEKNQKELERRNRELIDKNKELLEAQRQLKNQLREKTVTQKLLGIEELAGGIASEVMHPLGTARTNIQRLNDYFARAKQLLTILIGRDRNTPAVKEAMRRMDWELVDKGFATVSQEAVNSLSRVDEVLKELKSLASTHSDDEEKKIATDLNALISKAIDNVSVGNDLSRKKINIDRHLLLDRSVAVYPSRLEQAIMNLVGNALDSIPEEGTVRVAVRPKGKMAEIEISDTGRGMSDEEIKTVFSPYKGKDADGQSSRLSLSIAQSIVELHNGKIRVSGKPGSGSTFIVELPT